MTREEVFAGVNEVFQDVFDNKSIRVGEATTSADIEDWDSLEHINLIVAIEEKFQMKFGMGEAINMKNVGEMVDIIMVRSKE